MKIAIYTPYLDTLGGGERYILTAASILSKNGHKVFVQADGRQLLDRATERFGLDLSEVVSVPSVGRGEGYDVIIWLSDGSIPTLFARKNIVHIQRPFRFVNGKSLLSRIKFARVKNVIVNSAFTKHYTDLEFPVKSVVLYPPVDLQSFTPAKKRKEIAYVGRFSQLEQAKRQDVLLKTFIKMYKYDAREWKLVLAGGSDIGRTDEVDILKKYAVGHPIEVLEGPEFKKIRDIMAHATFFWSAAGYGVDENSEPNRMEHFGITLVEAMSAGCVPIVFDGGGHREIVVHGQTGFLWKEPKEMITFTKKLIYDSRLREKMSIAARERATAFSMQVFEKQLLSLI